MASVSFPHAHVPLTGLQERLAFAVTFASYPLSFVQIAIVKVAATVAVPLVVCPFAMILIVSQVLLVLRDETTLAFSHAHSQLTLVIARLAAPEI